MITLTSQFKEVYKEMYFSKKKLRLGLEDSELEPVLKEYILKVMGYSVYEAYLKYINESNYNPKAVFPYRDAVRKSFISLVQNFDYSKSRTITEAIEEYGTNFYPTLSKYKYVDKLIKAIRKIYSSDEKNPNIVIEQKEKMYKISLIDDKYIESMPTMVINNIENLNSILEHYLLVVLSTENNYKRIFDQPSEENQDDRIIELLMWTLINVSNEDVLDIERFFSKYITFISDTTFSQFKEHPQYLGDLLDDKLYLLERKSSCAYETPYYLAFMLCNRRVELPNIRIGIEDTGESKVAHILSIQTTQTNPNPKEDPIINKEIKELLPRTSYFREYNPSHLLSLVITLGMLNTAGIEKVYAYEYLPMRYQRFVNEGRKNEDELYQYQHRLTNKFINTFFRLIEFTNDIEIISYPENGGLFSFRLKKEIKFNNELLNKAYQIGYNQKDKINNYYERIKEYKKDR